MALDLDKDQDTYNILLVGITGAGKSSTANSILLSDGVMFKTGASTVAVTEIVQEEFGRVKERIVKVVDVPGLADSEKTDEDSIRHVAKQIASAVEKTPDGYDAIIIVITYGRLTRGDMVIVDQLKGIFGEKFIADYGVLLITKCKDFDPQETGVSTIKEWCFNQPGKLAELRRECCGRVVFFENKRATYEEKNLQLEQLFHIVEKMKYGPKRYTPELFKAAQAGRDSLLLNAKEVYLSEDMKKRLGLIKHELYAIKRGDAAEDILRLKKIDADAQEFIIQVKEQDKGTGKLGGVVETLELIVDIVNQKLAFVEANIEQSKQLKDLEDAISSLNNELKEKEQVSRREIAKKDEEIQNMEKKMDRAKREMERKFQDAMSKREAYLKSMTTLKIVSAISTALGGVGSLAHGVAGTVKDGICTHQMLRDL